MTGYLITLAFALQLADGAQTCVGLRHGAVELNPVFGRRPSCARVMGTKGAALALIPIARKGKWRNTMIAANIASGALGITITLYIKGR